MSAELPPKGCAESFYVIDLSALIYRYFHVGPRWAARQFADHMKRLGKMHDPAFVAVACDAHGWPTFRHELARETYKAHREKTQPAGEKALVLEQIRIAREYLDDFFGVVQFAARGFEADDVIATITRQAVREGLRVVVVSGDKDLTQLIDDVDPRRVVVWDGKEKIMGAAFVAEKFGVRPSQMCDFLALVGDAADGVSGVPGIGPQGASKLLAAFGSLDGALEAATAKTKHPFFKAAPGLRTKLAKNVEAARFARQLVALRYDVPLLRSDNGQPLASVRDLRADW